MRILTEGKKLCTVLSMKPDNGKLPVKFKEKNTVKI